MVQRKAFLANQEHQYRVFKCGEHDCSTHPEKNRDDNEYSSFSHSNDEH